MDRTRKEKRNTGQTHAYVQFILFCSLLTGLNLSKEADSRTPFPTKHSEDPKEPAATSNNDVSMSRDIAPVIVEPPVFSPEAYPSNRVRWGISGRPSSQNTGQFEIWDISQSPTRKIVRLFDSGYERKTDTQVADATVFLEPGGRVRVPVSSGTYEIIALAGMEWNGRDFGKEGITVSYRSRDVQTGQLTVLAIGAADDPASPISEEFP